MIGNNKKESSVRSLTVVEKGGKKMKESNLYVLFREERIKALTQSCEEILDAVGYADNQNSHVRKLFLHIEQDMFPDHTN